MSHQQTRQHLGLYEQEHSQSAQHSLHGIQNISPRFWHPTMPERPWWTETKSS